MAIKKLKIISSKNIIKNGSRNKLKCFRYKVKVCVKTKKLNLQELTFNGDLRKCAVLQKSTISICDLPIEILQMIFGKINIWHYNRIRGCCKTFQNAIDGKLMHDFKTTYLLQKKINPKSYQFAVLSVMEQASWPYVNTGHRFLFFGTMLPLLRKFYKNPFSPSVEFLKKFLLAFYKLVQESLGDPMQQKSRLLYTTTLLGFIQNCNKCHLVSSEDVRVDHWRANYEFRGGWFGILWASTSAATSDFNYLLDSNHLLIILAEIMISAHTGESFKTVWHDDGKVFVYGNDTSSHVKKPKTLFSINIQAAKPMLDFFKNVPQTDIFTDLHNLPQHEFKFSLKIHCTEADHWGCYKNYRLDIGQHCT